ncbi:MAG TPA: diguanylate cyclase [bacterium]|nr:diguanylate cyclase [bacterium]
MEEKVLQINPELAKRCLQSAHLYIETNRHREALRLFDEVIERYQPQNVEAHLESARIYAKYKQPHSILKVLNRLHNFAPRTPESLVLLARAQFLLELYPDCEESLKEIFYKRRDFPEAVALEAELCLHTGKFEIAIEKFESLSLRYPKNYNYLTLLALAHYASKRYHRTITLCTTLMQAGVVDPKVIRLYEMAKRKKRGEALGKLKKVKPLKWLFAQIFDPFLEKEMRAESQSQTTQEDLVQETLVDHRTGLLNDRAAVQQIPALAARRKSHFYLAMADIDFFKSFNDVHYNHQVGNAVLKALAKAGQQIFTKNRIWRYGGEEIIWVLDGSEEEAVEKAEQFRKYCEEKVSDEANEIIKKEDIRHFADGLDHKKDELFIIHYPVTISQAIVEWGKEGTSLESVLTAADNGLYIAKDHGRNTVVFQGDPKKVGSKPVKYTPEMLGILHELSLKKGSPHWWAHVKGLSDTSRDEALEYARNTLSDKEVMKK